ncbi:MAG: hypothetical protein ACTINL_03730 [Serratia proteamaculans]
MNVDKISFLYPSFIYGGEPANQLPLPDVGFKCDHLPTKLSFFVVTGILLGEKHHYSSNIALYFDDRELIGSGRDKVYSKMHKFGISKSEQRVGISSIPITNLEIDAEGTYKLLVTLYAGDKSDPNRKILDEKECCFVVSSNWRTA